MDDSDSKALVRLNSLSILTLIIKIVAKCYSSVLKQYNEEFFPLTSYCIVFYFKI